MALTNVELWPQFAKLTADCSKGVHRLQSIGVIVAKHLPPGVEGLLVEVAGALEVTEGSAGFGEIPH